MLTEFEEDVKGRKKKPTKWIKKKQGGLSATFISQCLSTMTESVVKTSSQNASVLHENMMAECATNVSIMSSIGDGDEGEKDVPDDFVPEEQKQAWDGDSAREQRVEVFDFKMPTSLQSLSVSVARPGNYHWKRDMRIKINPQYFACGEERHAHEGRFWDGKQWKKVVFKRFWKSGSCSGLNQYLDTVWQQKLARFVASQYNKERNRYTQPSEAPLAQVKYVDAMAIRTGNGEFWHMEFMLPDHGIDGFKKWANNTGVWDQVHMADNSTRSLICFAHFSSKATQKKMMISDLQGVYESSANTFHLTDPVIITDSINDFAKSGTNWGRPAMNQFFHVTKQLAKRLTLNFASND